MMDAGKTDQQIIATLNQIALSRLPTEEEMQASLDHISSKRDKMTQNNLRVVDQLSQLELSVAKIRDETREQLKEAKINTLPEGIRSDTKQALQKPAEKRSAIEEYLASKLGPMLQVNDAEIQSGLSESNKVEMDALQKKIAKLKEEHKTPDQIRILAIEDICWVILNRNEFLFNH